MKTKKKQWICVILLAVNVLFIWGNSLLPGTISGAISGWVRDMLASVLTGGTAEPGTGHGLVRKMAHFAEFTCLGCLFAWLFAIYKKVMWLALPCGILVAAIDETIQMFVPGRGPGIRDVVIDTSGVVLGMILLIIGYACIKRKRKKAMEDISI